MSVAAQSNSTFIREHQVQAWLDGKKSVKDQLDACFGPAYLDGEAWPNLFPLADQGELRYHSSTGKDYDMFVDCAESALKSVHENNENESKEETLAKKICCWVESLREHLVSNMPSHLPADGTPSGEPFVSAADVHANVVAFDEKKTIIAVEKDARELGRKVDGLTVFEMTLRLQDPENSQVINLLKDPPVFINESQSDGPPLCYGSEKCEEIDLLVRRKGEKKGKTECLFPDEDNRVKAEDARKAFVALNLSAKTDRDLVEELVDKLESVLTYGEEYCESLVDLSGTGKVRFAEFPGKSRVFIVAGESGSGKTTFSQYGIKRLAVRKENRDSTAVIYVSLDKEATRKFEDAEKEEDLSDEHVVVKMLISQSMRRFKDSKGEEGIQDSAEEAAYNLVSSLNTVLNKERNKLARSVFDDSIKGFFAKKEEDESKEWWEGRRRELVLDGLIIVLDEAGRSRKLVRGLVDIGRELVSEVVGGRRGGDGLPPRAKQCMIVLAGAGLDVVDETFQEAFEIMDPDKADFVVAKRVDFESPDFVDYLGDIKSEEVLKGTISSVLAENTRMLAKAILPSLNCKPLSDCYVSPFDKKQRTDHRIAAGSSRFFMNYASRIFVVNNGLSNLKADAIELIFQDAFRFFLLEAVKGICEEEAFLVASARKSLLEELSRKKIDERIFFFGVANRGQATSRAMQFLSCFGPASALVDGDGLHSEKAVSVHLARLSTSLGRKQLGTYVLKTGAPNKDRDVNESELEEDVKRIRGMFPDSTDVVREEGPWSLIMTRDVSDAAGPDTMELQLYAKDNGELSGVVDLYQSKLTETSYKVADLKEAAITLGRSPDDLGLEDDSQTMKMHAENVSHSLDTFVNKLGEEFGIEIAIGKRVIVIKESASEVRKSTKVVLGGGVTVWTREFLEPTCSLFHPSRTRQFE